jgi:hypothetical protein
MISDEKLKAIEDYARTLPNPMFVLDVEQLVAEVRRLQQESASTLEMYQIASKGLADMEAVARRLQAENQQLRAIRDTPSTSSRRT